MSTLELILNPDLADELKSLRRKESYDGAPLVLAAIVGRDQGTRGPTSPQFVREGVPRSPADANPVLSTIERLPGPVILASQGPLDAIGLALCCACTVAFLHPDAELTEIDAGAALELGLAGRLTERLGPAAAAQVLLGAAEPSQPSVLCNPQGDKGQRVAGPAVAFGLTVAAADPLAAARATAARLAAPGAALLARSLAFAARSTPAQTAAYDRELLALLTDTEL